MGTIIALKGRGGIGKTTTIGMLHAKMLANGFLLISSSYLSTGRDFSSIFTKKGKTIGLASWGDSEQLVKTKLDELISKGSEICVCACRSYGGTHTAINSFNPPYSANFISKNIATTQALQVTINDTDADTILTEINRLI